VLGKLAEIRDSGIQFISSLVINDLWMEDYFQKELNIPVYHDNKRVHFGNKTFFIGHVTEKDLVTRLYKRMKSVYESFFKWF
jgi:UDP-2,3-diacylglucosamine hydrolase